MTLNWSPIEATAIRINPGGDLKSELSSLASDHELQAAAVISAVGSLSKVSLRFANRPETTELDGKHEIICLLYTSPSPRDQRGSRMPSSA